MKTLCKLMGIALLACALPLASASASIIYKTDLTGAAAGTASTATGTATAILEDDMNTLDVMVAFSGLIGGPATAAHIHCCAAVGTNAGVRVPFAGFPNSTSGTFTASYNLTTTLLGMSLADFLTGLNAGLAYVNIHDSEFPVGEIRGQLVRVPEPASLALFGIGIAGLGWFSRRRGAA